MKKGRLLLFLILSSQLASAQYLTKNDIGFQVGESYSMMVFDTVVYPGPDGIGVIWDITPFATQSAANDITIGSNTSAAFPAANTVHFLNTYYESYFSVTDNSVELTGTNLAGYTENYTNPQTILKFPVTGTSDFTDTFEYIAGQNTGSGTVHQEFSGYGTLITPEGTFTDAVRLKQTQIRSFGNNSITVYDTTTTYNWYKAGIHHELASMRIVRSTSGNSELSYYTTVGQPLSKNEHNLSNITISPNPAAEIIQINGSEKINRLTIYGVSGEFILEKTTSNATISELIVEDLSPGIYFIHLFEENGTSSIRRFTKK